MGKLFSLKTIRLLIPVLIIISILVFPLSAFAWAAIKSETMGTSSFSVSPVSFIKSLPIIGDLLFSKNESRGPREIKFWPLLLPLFEERWDLDTHQMILETAYEKLSKDPAFKGRPEIFPSRDDFMQWEGVHALSIRAGYSWGALPKGGPDASEESRDAEHYYNPETSEGDAPYSIKEHFALLLSQMYPLPGSPVKGSKDAAWSAHYLADICVPYHVVGVPAGEVSGGKNILSPEKAGNYIMWKPSNFKMDADGYIDENSIATPPRGWGRDLDFSWGIAYFKEFRASDSYAPAFNKDWFDPWYYNGIWVPGTWNSRTATGSHASWEGWAHKYMVSNGMLALPTSYANNWTNAKPSFDSTLTSHLQKQAEKAAEFAISQAEDTRKNVAAYLKKPQLAANKGIKSVATLWRATVSAMEPTAKVEPREPKDSNRYRVTGQVLNAADEEAVDVKARLTVNGGKIIDREIIKPIGKLGKNQRSALLTWEIETTNIDLCQINMEVIGSFSQTPDLGYASVMATSPQGLTVTVSPETAKPGDKVTLSVKVSPARATTLNIKWGPLAEEPGPFNADTEGKFTRKFTIKQGIRDGKYDITVSAPQLNMSEKAILSIGQQAGLYSLGGCYVEYQVKGSSKFYSGNQAINKSKDNSDHLLYIGSFKDNVFNGTLRAAGNYATATGTVKITTVPTNDPNIYKITGYSVDYQSGAMGQYDIYLSGKTAMDLKAGGSLYFFKAETTGINACNYIATYKEKVALNSGSYYLYDQFTCTSTSYIRISFSNY